MQTPDGRECRFYYEDFHRGNDTQECRLIRPKHGSAEWRPKDCSICSVPDILRDNSDPNLVLEASLTKGFFGMGRKITVSAFCSKHLVDVDNPRSGCLQCNREKPGVAELFGDI